MPKRFPESFDASKGRAEVPRAESMTSRTRVLIHLIPVVDSLARSSTSVSESPELKKRRTGSVSDRIYLEPSQDASIFSTFEITEEKMPSKWCIFFSSFVPRFSIFERSGKRNGWSLTLEFLDGSVVDLNLRPFSFIF